MPKLLFPLCPIIPIPTPDPLGLALRDYWNGKADARITVHSSITEEEFIPAAYLFRDATTLPDLEKIALDNCRGRVLDAGAGAGSHALLLQERGLPVTALDLSRAPWPSCTNAAWPTPGSWTCLTSGKAATIPCSC
jgi:hypothetical protein